MKTSSIEEVQKELLAQKDNLLSHFRREKQKNDQKINRMSRTITDLKRELDKFRQENIRLRQKQKLMDVDIDKVNKL